MNTSNRFSRPSGKGYEALYGDALSIVGTFAGHQYLQVDVRGRESVRIRQHAHTQLGGDRQSMGFGPFPANLALRIAKTGAIADLISATSISGQAHDGSSYLPSDGTYHMQGGERVADRSANQDLTRYLSLANQTSNDNRRGGDFNITVPVTVEAKPGMSHQEAQEQGNAAGRAA